MPNYNRKFRCSAVESCRHRNGIYYGRPCRRLASVKLGDNWFCKIHAPTGKKE